jgi:hypothetical protein
MLKFLELSKVYLLEQSTEVTYEQLNTIITTPFSSSKYQTYGNFINVDPPAFLLMNKWHSWAPPMFQELSATKIIVTLEKNENRTRLIVITKTNPVLLLVFFLFVIGLAIQPITLQYDFELKHIFNFVLIIVLFFGADRFLKTQLYASLENDLKFVRRNKH